MEHGRNRLASRSSVQQTHQAKYWQCGMIDSQQHPILQCKHAPLIAVQENARTKQRNSASNLLKDYAKSQNLQHVIKQRIHCGTDTTMAGLYSNRDVEAVTNHPNNNVR
jgi:hypothetical protein